MIRRWETVDSLRRLTLFKVRRLNGQQIARTSCQKEYIGETLLVNDHSSKSRIASKFVRNFGKPTGRFQGICKNENLYRLIDSLSDDHRARSCQSRTASGLMSWIDDWLANGHSGQPACSAFRQTPTSVSTCSRAGQQRTMWNDGFWFYPLWWMRMKGSILFTFITSSLWGSKKDGEFLIEENFWVDDHENEFGSFIRNKLLGDFSEIIHH